MENHKGGIGQTSKPEAGVLSKAFTECDEIYFMSVVVEHTAGVVEHILKKVVSEINMVSHVKSLLEMPAPGPSVCPVIWAEFLLDWSELCLDFLIH